MLYRLTDLGIVSVGYADDVVLVAHGKFEATLCNLIQKVVAD